MEDQEIVELFLSRDESALFHTQQKYGARLRRIAFGILGDLNSAEECENDTYLEAWNRIPPHEPGTYLFAFLGRITRHLAIDECRRSAAQKRRAVFCELTREMEECIPAKNGVEEAADAEALIGTVNRFLSGLSKTRRSVFVRRYWFFDPISDIGKRFGFSRGKVKTMLFRTRAALREYLEKEGYTV